MERRKSASLIPPQQGRRFPEQQGGTAFCELGGSIDGVGLDNQKPPTNGLAQFKGQFAHPPGALLGRIGEDGQSFLVGANYNELSNNEGRLYVQILAGPFAQSGTATGSYKVKITGGRDVQGNR